MHHSCKPITELSTFKYPRRILFWDTESFIHEQVDGNELHTFRLGVAIYVELDIECKVNFREVYYYHSATDFWNYVESKSRKNSPLQMFAHNAKYDTLNVDILTELERLGYTVPYPVINNAFIINAFKGGKNRKKIKIDDTFNYVRTSIHTIGKKLGIEKIDLKQYKEYLSPTGDIEWNKIPDKILFPYCENDVEIIEKFMVQFIQLLKGTHTGIPLGSLKDTTASTSHDIYRHSFITEPIYYHHSDEILKLEREAYRGGIVECFYIGKMKRQKYYLLDINSMYVSVMASMKLPTYPIIYNDTPNLNDFIQSIPNTYLIADVLIDIKFNNGKYALKHNGKLIFPIGEYRLTLHSGELRELLKAGHSIKAVYRYCVYHEALCLEKYANYFSQMKINATNKVDYELYKLLGNGFYGRLGMRKYKSDKIKLGGLLDNDDNDDVPELSDNTKNKIKSQTKTLQYLPTSKGIYYEWNGEYIRSYTEELEHVPRTNVALAGAVTTYSRLLLSKYIELCGNKNIFYSDTDSLVVNETGYRKLKSFIDDKELGKLKLELTFNAGVINAPKNYVFKQVKNLIPRNINKNRRNRKLILKQKSINISIRKRSKGIPTGAINNDGVYTFWRFTTFKEFMKSSGDKKGRIQVTRKNTNEYTKGNRLNKNGFTKPYVMKYSEEYYKQCQENVIQTKTMQKKLSNKKQKIITNPLMTTI